MTKRFSFLLLALAPLVLDAAPVPMPPAEDLRSYRSLKDFNAATLDVMGTLPAVEDFQKGYGYTTAKGWYRVRPFADGVMVLSTVPDGRMKYGYFSEETGQPLPYQWDGQEAPASCAACHNRNRER